MEILVDALHVLKGNLLPQHHLVKRSNEERIQEPMMEYSQTNDTPNELEVVQVLIVDSGMRVYLERVVIVSGVFKQAVEGVEHFVG